MDSNVLFIDIAFVSATPRDVMESHLREPQTNASECPPGVGHGGRFEEEGAELEQINCTLAKKEKERKKRVRSSVATRRVSWARASDSPRAVPD